MIPLSKAAAGGGESTSKSPQFRRFCPGNGIFFFLSDFLPPPLLLYCTHEVMGLLFLSLSVQYIVHCLMLP